MVEIKFKILHNGNPIDIGILEIVKEITVVQEIGVVWEARINISVFLDDNGNWSTETDELKTPFSRIRIEIQSNNSDYIPLIDGPVVGFDFSLSPNPGESSIIVIVQDDSIFLNQNDEIVKFENMADHEIAQEVFSQFPQIISEDIESTPIPPQNSPIVVIQRGTAINFLKKLAQRQGMYVYVLPGSSSGQSIGCFKSTPTTLSELTPLILLGSERNIESFSIKNYAQNPANIKASSLISPTKEVISSISSIGDINLLGDEICVEDESNLPIRLLPPIQGETIDLDQAVFAEARRSTYALKADGRLNSTKYPDILLPYHIISVYGVRPDYSGNYLIREVTHKITPSQYSQSFKLQRNAITTNSINISEGVF